MWRPRGTGLTSSRTIPLELVVERGKTDAKFARNQCLVVVGQPQTGEDVFPLDVIHGTYTLGRVRLCLQRKQFPINVKKRPYRQLLGRTGFHSLSSEYQTPSGREMFVYFGNKYAVALSQMVARAPQITAKV